VLGGIYATLCQNHGERNSGADRIVAGCGEAGILKLVEAYTGFSTSPKFDPDNLNTYPYPALDLLYRIPYVPLLTSKGCPFSCAYCASHLLNPMQSVREPESVVDEILHWNKTYGVRDFVFYDDALLADPERHGIPLFEEITKAGLRIHLHTPNAVHIRGISPEVSRLMVKAGVITLRLGLETIAFEKRDALDTKVTQNEFMHAVACLKDAGFKKEQVGVYLLVGLPGQSLTSVADAVKTVGKSGLTPVLAYYSPIPHTALWPKAAASSRYDLESDPLFTNNAILPCQNQPFSWKTVSYLKNLAAIF
jgi:radical SAM superfamily enzyme YgiQ (UPF0313 family)